MATDPYAALGDVVSSPSSTAAPSAPTANDPYAALGDVEHPITDSGLAGGFRDQNPDDQASSQLSPQETKEFYHLLQGGADADTLRQYVASKGHTLTNADDIVAQRDKLGRIAGVINYPLPKPVEGTSAAGSAVRGAAEGATLGFGDELVGAAQAAKAALTGGDPSAAYDQSVDQSRGLLAADQEQHPYASIAGNLAGGLALPVVGEEAGLTRALSSVAEDAYRAARLEGFGADEARIIAQRTVARRVAAEGASYGAAYGAGSADGSPSQRLEGALEGGLEGGVGGAVLGGIGSVLAGRSNAARQAARALPLTEGQETAAAAQRLGIVPFAADVGGPTTRRLTAATAQTPLGASPVIKAAQRVGDQAQEARDRIASSVGNALDPEAMGNQGRQGALSYIQSSGQAARGIYNAAEKASQGATIQPRDALATLDRNIEELSQTPGGAPGVERLKGLRDAIAGKPTLEKGGVNDGWQQFTFNDVNGQTVPIEVKPNRSGAGLEVSIDENGDRANQFGLSQLRQAASYLKQEYPSADYIYGSRTTGAGPGRQQMIDLNALAASAPERSIKSFGVAGIRNMRTVLRQEFIKDGLVGSDLERRVNQTLDAASNDVVNGLNAQGKSDAARYFAQADAAWKARMDTINNVIKPLIGTRDAPKSGEQIAKSLTADLQGNQARAVKFIRSLPDSEGRDVRASIIGALGRANPGNQNSAGDSFSLNQFLTGWNKIGPTAKRAFFDDETRSALEDLSKVAQGSREAGAYANRSNTGGAIGGLATGATSMLGLATLGKALALQYGAGRLLASPSFARWLARAPRTTLSPAAYADRLTRIARADPGIASEALGLHRALIEQFRSHPNVAAEQDYNSTQPNGN